jgi:alpha,alpha-trehalase
MVVPGGRFRESYYWDSYWIIRGLLVCNMTTTAWCVCHFIVRCYCTLTFAVFIIFRSVISNLLEDVTNFGYVPNGGRVYYLDRSQPPYLTLMIAEYLDTVGKLVPN